MPPHRVILNGKDLKDHYYLRTGSSFVVASHPILADMFGRRPRPELALSVRLVQTVKSHTLWGLGVLLGIVNKGRGSAERPSSLCV